MQGVRGLYAGKVETLTLFEHKKLRGRNTFLGIVGPPRGKKTYILKKQANTVFALQLRSIYSLRMC